MPSFGLLMFLRSTIPGLDKYDTDGERPIAYTHLDIAAAASNFPEFPNYSGMNAINYKYFYKSKK